MNAKISFYALVIIIYVSCGYIDDTGVTWGVLVLVYLEIIHNKQYHV